MAVDLVSYRDDLEDMTAEALTEYYNHSAGLKPTMEMTRVYDHYAHLTSLESALELAAMDAPTELQRFAAEAYMGDGTKQLTDQAANLEASLTVPFDGGQVPYRQVRPLLLNEPDAARRRELYRSRCEVTERDLNPVLAELAERERVLAAELGGPTVLSLYERLGFDPAGLAARTEAFLADTESRYTDELDRQLRSRLGVSLDEAGPSDLSRLDARTRVRSPASQPERALPALRETLTGLGIDLDRQPNVELDVEARPGKVPARLLRADPGARPGGAGGAAAGRPGGLRRAVPRGRAHGALRAHAAHVACRGTGAGRQRRNRGIRLPAGAPDRRRTAGWRRGWTCPEATSSCASRHSSRCSSCAGTAPSCATSWSCTPGRRSAPCPAATRSSCRAPSASPIPSRTSSRTWTAASTAPATCGPGRSRRSCREWLRERYGQSWFAQREAGTLVRELWELGQSLNADALLREVTGQNIDFGVLSDRARDALS